VLNLRTRLTVFWYDMWITVLRHICCLSLLIWCFDFTHDLGTCKASRFDSNSNRLLIRFKNDGPIRKFLNLKPLVALSGTVYRLVSSMSDTPVLFNMFEEWNEKSVVLHISFVSFVINYWLLNAQFDSYSVAPSWNMLSFVHNGRLYML